MRQKWVEDAEVGVAERARGCAGRRRFVFEAATGAGIYAGDFAGQVEEVADQDVD